MRDVVVSWGTCGYSGGSRQTNATQNRPRRQHFEETWQVAGEKQDWTKKVQTQVLTTTNDKSAKVFCPNPGMQHVPYRHVWQLKRKSNQTFWHPRTRWQGIAYRSRRRTGWGIGGTGLVRANSKIGGIFYQKCGNWNCHVSSPKRFALPETNSKSAWK